jgi:hypothetical protein
MSINKLISIKNAVIDAMDELNIDHNAYLPKFMNWATRAEDEIGSYYQYVRKWKPIDICGCSAHLPEDAVKVEYAILGDHGSECGDYFYRLFSVPNVNINTVGNSFVVVDVNPGDGSNVCGTIPYGYQDNKIVFDVQPKQDKVTIQYIGYSTDCEGFINISENHVEAITAFIKYKWLGAKRNKSGADLQEMQFYYREWDRLCAHSRAKDSELTETEREEIAQLWHNPYSGRGLYIGMNVNRNYGRNSY